MADKQMTVAAAGGGEADAASHSDNLVTLHAVRGGQWMEAADLREWLLARYSERKRPDFVLDLSGIDHLDASILQVLLAAGAEQKKRGGCFRLTGASASLRQWFTWAGAAVLLAESPQKESVSCAKS